MSLRSNAGVEPSLDRAKNSPVTDAVIQEFHYPMQRDRVEPCPIGGIDDPSGFPPLLAAGKRAERIVCPGSGRNPWRNPTDSASQIGFGSTPATAEHEYLLGLMFLRTSFHSRSAVLRKGKWNSLRD